MHRCTGYLAAVQSEITSVNIEWIYAYYCVGEEENKIVCKISKILIRGKMRKEKQRKKREKEKGENERGRESFSLK